MAPPPVGAPEETIDGYLGRLRYDIQHTKHRLRHAKQIGDLSEVQRLEPELRRKDELRATERDRLTERDDGMVIGGAVSLGVGGASLIASFSLYLAAVFNALGQIDFFGESRPDDTSEELREASLAMLGVGIAGVAVGTPTLIVGALRRPRAPDEIPVQSRGEPSGATVGLTWSF